MTAITHFERFWSIYPRKIAKGQAQKTWAKLTKGQTDDEQKEFADLLIGSVDAQKRSRQEQDRAGQFVPPWKHPTTWLNGECWNDEIKSTQEIRESTDKTAVCDQCHKTGSYRDRGWIVRGGKIWCSPCFAMTFEDGPTGLRALREAGKRQLQSKPRIAGERWDQYFYRVHGSPKKYGVGINQTEVTEPGHGPESDINGDWSAEKCAREME